MLQGIVAHRSFYTESLDQSKGQANKAGYGTGIGVSSSPGKEPIWEAATVEPLVAFFSLFVKGIISAIMSGRSKETRCSGYT
jgi:hypothetical protein